MVPLEKQSRIFFLKKALRLAQAQRGFCAPNPAVGTLIVDANENILAEGTHQGYGFPHAEIEALKQINNAKGASLYVTLEPCCHHGKTPPCTDAIIEAGIAEVFYSYQDPNPVVSGKGAIALKKAGVKCQQIVLPEINQFYQSYQYWHENKKPFVTAKIALSLNGKIAGAKGQPLALTGKALQKLTHIKRKMSDAILTTAKTIHFDNPRLNVREEQEVIAKPIYILDSHLTFDPNAIIFKTAKSITLFHSTQCSLSTIAALTSLGIRCVPINQDKYGLSLQEIILQIGADGIHDLWVEVGGKCLSSFINEQQLQKLILYIAPKWIDNGQNAFEDKIGYDFQNKTIVWRQYDNDLAGEIIF